ncbi:amino acid/polyamine transporter I, partial [Pyrenochaeta sp. MPI-SDFR-AT-0127]
GILKFTMLLLLAYFIGLFAASKERRPAREFFTDFQITTGWSNGLPFLTAPNGSNWGFSCLDAIVHIAEEIPRPSVNIPKALMLTIAVGFFTGLPIIFVFGFCMTDLDTQYSALTTLYEVFGQKKAAAIGYQVTLFFSTVGAMWGIHVWQSRLAWTIGLNKEFPFARHLGKVHGAPFHTPIWALMWSAGFTGLCSFVYVASETAFNPLVAAGILFQYISYAIPLILLLRHRRSKVAHGPFWYPRLGLLANIVFLSWAPVALLIYCFPYAFPVVTGDMNYVSVVLIIVFLIIVCFWFSFARKSFSFPKLGSHRSVALL